MRDSKAPATSRLAAADKLLMSCLSSDEKTNALISIFENSIGTSKPSGTLSQKKNMLPREVKELISDKRWSSKLPSHLSMWVTAQVHPFMTSSAQNYGALQDEAMKGDQYRARKEEKEEKGKVSSELTGITLGGIPIKAPVKQIKVKKRVTPTSMSTSSSIASPSSSGNISALPNASGDMTKDMTKAAERVTAAVTVATTTSPVAAAAATVQPRGGASGVVMLQAANCGLEEDLPSITRLSAVYSSLVLYHYEPIVQALSLLTKLLSLLEPPRGWHLVLRESKGSDGSRQGLFRSLTGVHFFACKALEKIAPLVRHMGIGLLGALSACPVTRSLCPGLTEELATKAEDVRGNEDHLALPEVFIRPFREETDSRLEYKTPYEGLVYNERERCFDELSNLFHTYQEAHRSDITGRKVSEVLRKLPAIGTKVLNLRDCNFFWFADIFVKMLLFHGLNIATGTSALTGPLAGASTPSSAFSSTQSTPTHRGSRCGQGSGASGAPDTQSSSGSGAVGMNVTQVVRNGTTFYTAPSASKQRKLEERLGPGGRVSVRATSNSATSSATSLWTRPAGLGRATDDTLLGDDSSSGVGAGQRSHTRQDGESGRTGSVQSNAPSSNADLYEVPSLFFPGAQQFFFRFIVAMDNQRFAQSLEACLCAEIVDRVESGTGLRGGAARRRSSRGGVSAGYSGHTATEGPSPEKRVMQKLFVDSHLSDDEGEGGEDSGEIPGDKETGAVKSLLSDASPFSKEERLLPSTSSLSESFTERVMKLKILGRFLGLVKFWPTWTLSMRANTRATQPGVPAKGPLSFLLEESARNRAAMRSTLPLRSMLEDSWREGNTCFMVPWCVEFLKMARWDSSSAKYEGYREALDFMRGIQTSELFSTANDTLTRNRVHVLLEIQSLWSVMPQGTYRPKGGSSGDKEEGFPVLKGSSGSTLRVDDQNNAFSRTYNHHVAPELEDLVVNMVQRLHKNKKKSEGWGTLSCHVDATGGSGQDITDKASEKYKSAVGETKGAGEGDDRESHNPTSHTQVRQPGNNPVVKRKHRVTPTSLSSGEFKRAFAGAGHNPFASDLGPHGGPSPSSFSSLPPPPGFTSPVPSLRNTQGGGPIPPRSLAHSGSTPPPFGQLESVFKEAAEFAKISVSTPLSRALANAQGDKSPTSSSPILSRASPATIDGNVSPVAAMSSALHENTNAAARAKSGSPLSKSLGELVQAQGRPYNEQASAQEQLELAFWQQHPQLLYMSSFLLEHRQAACHAHLKERVAVAVRQFWEVCGALRDSLESEVETKNAAQLAQAFKSSLSDALASLHRSTVESGNVFIKDFLLHRLTSATLPELCSLYPGHERIQSVAVALIQKQSAQQQAVLVDFVSAYAKRKLREVLEISARQYDKYLEDKGSTLHGRRSGSSTAAMAKGTAAGRNGGGANEQTPLPWGRVIDPLGTIIGRIDASLQGLAGFLRYSSVKGNESQAALVFTGQLSGEFALVEGHLPACLFGESSYGALEVRDAVNIVLVNLEKLVHAVGALCAYALNVDDGSQAVTRQWAVESTSHLSTFLDCFQRWTQRVHSSLGIEGGRFSVDVTKFCILTLPTLLYLDVTAELLGPMDGLPSSLAVSGLVERGCMAQSSFCRVVTSTARKATMKYYAKCRGMVQLEEFWSSALLAFLSWHLKITEKEVHGICVDVAPRSTDKTCFPSWCMDDRNRKQFAKVMGADLSALLSRVLSKQREKDS